MPNIKKFFLSWLFSSVIMFSLSYAWHGIFLNDLQRLSYPLEFFLTGAILVYLLLGFLLTKIYQFKYPVRIARRPIIRGIISGVLLGVLAYLSALVIGVSFSSELTPLQILFDMGWQVAEQTIGGIAVGIVYIWIYEGNPVKILGRKMLGD